MAESLEAQVARARDGDKDALEQVILGVQDKVYGLALRMLWHPEDAREATQEILVRIVTRLGGFRGESAFLTWVYRVAANYLLNARRSRLEEQRYTFERFGAELEEGLSDAPLGAEVGVDHALLLEEIKIGCTLGMLTCLDRPHRLAYILGEILERDGAEGAAILGIAPAAFRKRLSRARAAILTFTRAKCGLVNPERACRCRHRVTHALRTGRVNPERLLFAHDRDRAGHFPGVLAEIRRLEEVRRAAALYRSHPEPRAPSEVVREIRRLVEGAGA